MRPLLNVLDNNLKEKVVNEAFEVLEEIGFFVENEEAVQILQDAGIQVDEKQRAKLPRDIIKKSLKTAPSSITLFDREGNSVSVLEGDNMLKRKFPVLFIAFLFFSNCQSPLEGLDLLFPAKDFQTNWKWDGRPVHYIPVNLYELINGEAELSHAYGFQELSVLSYYNKSPLFPAITCSCR